MNPEDIEAKLDQFDERHLPAMLQASGCRPTRATMNRDGDVLGRQEVPESAAFLMRELDRLQIFVLVTMGGHQYGSSVVEKLHVFRDIYRTSRGQDLPDEPFERMMQLARKWKSFATTEREDGHPYLFSLVTIRLWTMLEAAVDLMLIEALRERPEARALPFVQKLEGPLLAFAQSSPDEQWAYLAELIKEQVKVNLKTGVGRLESALKAVGLDGPVAEEVRRTLIELSATRHVIVHRDGRADAKFLERCPWLSYRVGENVKITYSTFDAFARSATWYLVELSLRWVGSKGFERDPDLTKGQLAIEDWLAKWRTERATKATEVANESRREGT